MHRQKGKPVAVVEHYAGTDTSFKTVAVWKVGQVWELEHGRLDRINLASNKYASTRFRLSVLGKVLFKDLELVESLTLAFSDNELPGGEEIKIECRSSDGTSIGVHAGITGVEF